MSSAMPDDQSRGKLLFTQDCPGNNFADYGFGDIAQYGLSATSMIPKIETVEGGFEGNNL